MMYVVHRASDYRFCEEVIISSLEDLRALQERFGYQLVVDFEDREITIYDDYMD